MRSMVWRLILLSPLLLLVILFALSNAESVRLGLWPTDIMVQAPLSLLILAAMAIAFLLGALSTWVVGLGARLRARRAEALVARLRAELDAAQAGLKQGGVARAQQPGGVTILPPERSVLAQPGPQAPGR